jgi:uncharacterized membrane protein
MILNEKESMSNRLTEIIKQVQNLPPSELNELREVVETAIEQATSDRLAPLVTEDEFEQRMKSRGFLRQVLPPVTDFSPYEKYQPVKVQGQPLSEMIIAERR